MLGIKATVFMPEGAPIPKTNATRGYGADVRFAGEYLTQALVAAQEFADETGAVFIHPFDHADIVAGQGTTGLEILQQAPEAATVLVPTGGGGLLAGSRSRSRGCGPTYESWECRPRGPPRSPSHFAQGAPVALEQMTTMADGIAVAWPGDVPFAAIQKYVDDVVTVSEDSMSRALVMLLERAKMVVEPSGAAAVAALMDQPKAFGTPVVAVLSGGNVDPLLLGKLIRHGLASGGRYMNLQVHIPDRPGGLARLLAELADAGANVLEVVARPDLQLAAHRRGRGPAAARDARSRARRRRAQPSARARLPRHRVAARQRRADGGRDSARVGHGLQDLGLLVLAVGRRVGHGLAAAAPDRLAEGGLWRVDLDVVAGHLAGAEEELLGSSPPSVRR